jgi:hypothetical protein
MFADIKRLNNYAEKESGLCLLGTSLSKCQKLTVISANKLSSPRTTAWSILFHPKYEISTLHGGQMQEVARFVN